MSQAVACMRTVRATGTADDGAHGPQAEAGDFCNFSRSKAAGASDRDGRPYQELAAALAPARDVDQAVHGLAHEHFSSTSRTTKPDCCSYRAPHPRTACAAIMILGAATQRPLVS